MSDSSRPFGHNTIRLNAVIVPEGENPQGPEGQSASGIGSSHASAMFGRDTLKLRAVLVPEGSSGAPPGYPFVHFGKTISQAASDDPDTAPDYRELPVRPNSATGFTRGDGPNDMAETSRPPTPPNPALAVAGADAMRHASSVLQGLPSGPASSIAGTPGGAGVGSPAGPIAALLDERAALGLARAALRRPRRPEMPSPDGAMEADAAATAEANPESGQPNS